MKLYCEIFYCDSMTVFFKLGMMPSMERNMKNIEKLKKEKKVHTVINLSTSLSLSTNLSVSLFLDLSISLPILLLPAVYLLSSFFPSILLLHHLIHILEGQYWSGNHRRPDFSLVMLVSQLNENI